MDRNPHFEALASWEAARAWLTFDPLEPAETLGCTLQSLRVHVRDHRHRELPAGERSFEAHYGAFTISQQRRSEGEAARLALDVAYGPDPRPARILGRPGRLYELGPEPAADDVDGRSPAVVVWHDGELFFLVASTALSAQDLLRVATSIHAPRQASEAGSS